jgi:hypothetical protein
MTPNAPAPGISGIYYGIFKVHFVSISRLFINGLYKTEAPPQANNSAILDGMNNQGFFPDASKESE